MKINTATDEIIIYEGEGGQPKIEVHIEGETVWLSQVQLAELFNTTKQNISLHIQNIFAEGELTREATVKEYLIVQTEGSREVSRQIEHYNLDLIISLGYRIKSDIATKFRQWATARLREYIIKGFAIDDERLKNAGGGGYWKELLDTIRDIRSSEKVLYRQVLDLYATSIDYDPKSNESKKFFSIIQNKLHYAANGKTAAELIFERADAAKPFMGLLTFGRDGIRKVDVTVAKNYLTEQEIKRLNNVVSAYFDIAELRALDHKTTKMQDYLDQLDKLIASMDRSVLKDAGKISRIEAEAKAHTEYVKYQAKTLSSVEKAYLDTIKEVQRKVEKKAKLNK